MATKTMDRPATTPQRELLAKLNVTPPPDLTMTQASELIERTRIAMIEQARRAADGLNLIDLAEQRVELRKESTREYSGPCPKCGGNDRFHVSERMFFCRQCYPLDNNLPHDALGFLSWLDGGDFLTLCARLVGGVVPLASVTTTQRTPTHRKPEKDTEDPAKQAARLGKIADDAHAALFNAPEAEPARNYLFSRSLSPETWLTYRLGFAMVRPPQAAYTEAERPAITIPWIVGGRVVHIGYRFLELVEYTDQEGKPRAAKKTSIKGGQFAGKLFGGQARMDGCESLRTLMIVEGELNCASVWQLSHDAGLDVLSTGSESATLTDAAVSKISEYKTVLVWMDESKHAVRLAERLKAAGARVHCFRSPKPEQAEKELDANDLLRTGQLGGFIIRRRIEAIRLLYQPDPSTELQRLLWSAYDAARLPNGIDASTAAEAAKLGKHLGYSIELTEGDSSQWIAR